MQALGLQTYIWNNNLRSILLLAGFPILLMGMIAALEAAAAAAGMVQVPPGASLAGLILGSAPLAIVVAVVWFAIAYLCNQAIIDGVTGARAVERGDAPELYNLLENLCISRGLRTPTLRIIETDGMNAFASGLHEGRFSVTVTRGLLDNLDRDELEAVLAHELSHIINRDVRTMVVAAVFVGIITLICQLAFRALYWGSWGGLRVRSRDRSGNLGLFLMLAVVIAAVGYLLAIVVQMALSRRREYVADAGSAQLTKNPDAMISALMKVAGHEHLEAPQSVRAMFLEDRDEGVFGLFVTHPPIARRIAALQQYAGGRSAEPALPASGPAAAPIRPGPWSDPAEASPEPPGAPDHKPGPWG